MEKGVNLSISVKEGYWQNIIKEWENSGLSQAEFCRRQKIAHSNFFNWRKRLQESSEALAPGLGRVTIKQDASPVLKSHTSATPLVLELRNELRIEVRGNTDKSALKMLLEVLGVLPC